jgi:hypothetical protein
LRKHRVLSVRQQRCYVNVSAYYRVSSYYYRCVLILLYTCAHATRCFEGSAPAVANTSSPSANQTTGTQFTCFDSTKVQILTRLRRPLTQIRPHCLPLLEPPQPTLLTPQPKTSMIRPSCATSKWLGFSRTSTQSRYMCVRKTRTRRTVPASRARSSRLQVLRRQKPHPPRSPPVSRALSTSTSLATAARASSAPAVSSVTWARLSLPNASRWATSSSPSRCLWTHS